MADEEKTDETMSPAAPETGADALPEAEALDEQTPGADAEPGEPESSADESPSDSAQPNRSEPKRKRKRLPRSQRPVKTRPKRPASPGERKPIVREPKPETLRGRRQERRGVVVSDAMDKTIVVKVEAIRSHPKYKKVIRRSVKFHAHDEQNAAHIGDIVRIVETRPLSKTKNWRLAEIVEAAK